MIEVTRINLWRKPVPWWCVTAIHEEVRAVLNDPLSDIEFAAALPRFRPYFDSVIELRHATMLEF